MVSQYILTSKSKKIKFLKIEKGLHKGEKREKMVDFPPRHLRYNTPCFICGTTFHVHFLLPKLFFSPLCTAYCCQLSISKNGD